MDPAYVIHYTGGKYVGHLIKGMERSEKTNSTNHYYRYRNYHRIERTYGSFSRVIHLPRDIDGKTAQMKLENGVHEIAVRAKR